MFEMRDFARNPYIFTATLASLEARTVEDVAFVRRAERGVGTSDKGPYPRPHRRSDWNRGGDT